MGKKCIQIEGMIGGSRSTEVWKTVKGMKTNNTQQGCQLISMSEWEGHYEKLLTENRREFKEMQRTIEEKDNYLLITEE